MKFKEAEKYLLSKPGTKLDFPFGEDVAVYKFYPGSSAAQATKESDKGKIFAIMPVGKDPVRISLKCDPQLAELLREKYDTVQPGYHLNKQHWNTIVLTGQVPEDEVKDLVDHSYQLVSGTET